jgi:VWFA-related protein
MVEEKSRAAIRIHILVAAGMLAIAIAGCASTTMAPIAMPAQPGQLNLCTGGPVVPPNNLASNPNYVEFAVDVIDSTGASTSGLTQSDFVATENDRPIPVAYFRTEQGRPPVSIGILVDKSGSMVTKLPVVTASVEALLSKLDPCDEVFLFAFGLDPILVEDFTTDHTIISQRLSLVGASGQTPFYDGVQQGIARLGAGHYQDRVIIIFTDDLSSLDNASKRATRDDLVSSAENSQSRFFVVGVGKPDAFQLPSIGIFSLNFGTAPNGVGAKDLKKFATDLGGEFFLIAAEPDEKAPEVWTRAQASLFSPPPTPYAPLAADPGEIQQFANSIASQIDRHYTIGLIASSQSASVVDHITIKANRPSARTTFHQIKLSPATP